MEVVFNCPCCDREVEANAELGGGMAQCPGCHETILVPAAGIGEGTQIAGYKIVRQLGTGGMGEVFLATQVAMDRQVALKVLPPAMTNDEDSVNRFLHEVRMAAKLEHPNIVTAFDAGEADGYYFLAMSYVEGEDLDDRIAREGSLDERDALVICLEVAEALAYAWGKHKILHRDVKPANIMIDLAGEVKLMDMGIAKSLADDSNLTMAGMYVGTPFYMSPEQCRAETDLDCRSDVYALGATLYHLVTGEKPFVAASSVAVLTAHLTQPLSSPRVVKPELSIAFDHLLSRMMAKDRDKRYAGWEELIADLRVLLDAPDPAALRLPTLPDPLPTGGSSAAEDPPATLVTQLSAPAPGPVPELKPRSETAASDAGRQVSGDSVPGLKPVTEDAVAEPLPMPASAMAPKTPKTGDVGWESAVPTAPDRSLSKAIAFAIVVLVLAGVTGGGFWMWQQAKKAGDERVVKHQEDQAAADLETVAAVEGAIAYQQKRAEISAQAAEMERRLGEMLAEAAAYEKAQPRDVPGALAKYQAVAERAAGTRYELTVSDEIKRLEKRLADAPEQLIADLRRRADAMAQSWRLQEAAGLLAGYDGPLAAATDARRQELAGSYLATQRLVEALVVAMRPGMRGLAELRLVPVREVVVSVEARPEWRQEPMAREVAAGLRDVLSMGNQFFESFDADTGKALNLEVYDREGRWRIRGIGDLRLRADFDGRTQDLPMGAFSAREILGRLGKRDERGYQLVKAVLAGRAGRTDVVTSTLAGLPDGILVRAIAGELALRRLSGEWTGTAGTRAVFEDGSLRATVGGRSLSGPAVVFAGQLWLLDGEGGVGSRIVIKQDGSENSLQLRLEDGESMSLRRGK